MIIFAAHAEIPAATMLIHLRTGLLRRRPSPAQIPRIRFEVVLDQVNAVIRSPYLEIIRPRPFRQALDLMPPVQHLLNVKPLTLAAEAPWRLVGFVTGVTLGFDGNQSHGLEFGARPIRSFQLHTRNVVRQLRPEIGGTGDVVDPRPMQT